MYRLEIEFGNYVSLEPLTLLADAHKMSLMGSNLIPFSVLYKDTFLVNIPASIVHRASKCCKSNFEVSYIRHILSIPSPLHSLAFQVCALWKDKNNEIRK